jgi:hypothetical protein
VTQRLILLAGSQDFSNEEFQLLVIEGFRAKLEDCSFNIFETSFSIPRGNRERKEELLEALRKNFGDSRPL